MFINTFNSKKVVSNIAVSYRGPIYCVLVTNKKLEQTTKVHVRKLNEWNSCATHILHNDLLNVCNAFNKDLCPLYRIRIP